MATNKDAVRGAMFALDPSGNPAGLIAPSGALASMPFIPAGGQSAVPVMIAQSSQVQAGGLMVPGPITAAVTVTLSATSGAGVVLTLNTALLAGTSSDNGKQITVYDAANSVWRSALITTFSTTLIATVTLLGTWSSTSIAATTVSLGNPLPTNYTGGIWAYLPSGAVSGSAAGFYWGTATSTATANGILQVTTAYQATMGTPSIPTGFSNAVGSGSNFTQTTSAVTLASVTVPGGSMGANGALRIKAVDVIPNTSGVKTGSSFFGGILISSWGLTTGNLIISEMRQITNRGVQNAQMNGYGDGVSGLGSGTFTPSLVYTAVDSSVTQNLTRTGQLAVATDFIVLEGYTVEVLPRA